MKLTARKKLKFDQSNRKLQIEQFEPRLPLAAPGQDPGALLATNVIDPVDEDPTILANARA